MFLKYVPGFFICFKTSLKLLIGILRFRVFVTKVTDHPVDRRGHKNNLFN